MFFDIQHRMKTKRDDLYALSQSIEDLHRLVEKFHEYLTVCERYLNGLKPISRYSCLSEQMTEHEMFEKQLEIYEEFWMNLNEQNRCLRKQETISLVTMQTRWQKIRMRSVQRRKDLEKKKNVNEIALFLVRFDLISMVFS